MRYNLSMKCILFSYIEIVNICIMDNTIFLFSKHTYLKYGIYNIYLCSKYNMLLYTQSLIFTYQKIEK